MTLASGIGAKSQLQQPLNFSLLRNFHLVKRFFPFKNAKFGVKIPHSDKIYEQN